MVYPVGTYLFEVHLTEVHLTVVHVNEVCKYIIFFILILMCFRTDSHL